jgi:predicted enzyme related to lactoylglutathione lyase
MPMPRPIHFEIHAENTERAIAFYRDLLGWEFSQWGKEPYWLVKTGEKGTPGIDGGLMPRRGPAPAGMQPVNAFVCTVDVANLDAMVKRVTEIGGTIALPRMPIPTVGWLAYAKDTEGNLFGMMQMDANAK